jgi:uncharacterized iron-regulated membrane protein
VQYFRVREGEGAAVVSNPETGEFFAPDRSKRYPADHWMVQHHGWLFVSEDDLADGVVEQADRGSRRRTRRGPAE